MWDDLFRAAAGEDDVVESQFQTIETQDNSRKRGPSTSRESQAQKKKKKRSRGQINRQSSQELLERILESRTNPIDQQVWSKLPAWLSPGSSLCSSDICQGWEQDSDCELSSKCKNCGRAILYHSLAISPSVAWKRNNVRMALDAFALVRNIRCSSVCYLDGLYELGGDETSGCNLDSYIISAATNAIQLVSMNFLSILGPGEADILMEKFRKIKRAATSLREKLQHLGSKKKKKRFKPGCIFDGVVRLIISCDAAYFRMYYLQNSGNLPIENEDVFLPHPPTYFGSQNIAWNVHDHTKDLIKSVKKKHAQITEDRWDDLLKELGVEQSSRGLDSLSFMQKNRLSESILLFRKTSWVDSKEINTQFIESIMHQSKERDLESLFYTTHETPAPAILREWRDSCRDFLCNLYAYATITPRIVDDVKTILLEKQLGYKHIVEIGAGTGYVANLLSKAGLSVTAFDVAPTTEASNETNEYHGSSPPFCRVEYGDSKNLGSVFGRRNTKESVLLLCYPPPLSNMAEASLKSFVKHGGKTIIHVGEFSGLTGSSKFEDTLSCDFDLKYRARCLNWGSDAAELTIWTKMEQSNDKRKDNLVRCSRCNEAIATKRLRICRPLAYSTAACFDAHKVERGLHFTFNMIPEKINTSILFGAIDAKKYFESLPSKYN